MNHGKPCLCVVIGSSVRTIGINCNVPDQMGSAGSVFHIHADGSWTISSEFKNPDPPEQPADNILHKMHADWMDRRGVVDNTDHNVVRWNQICYPQAVIPLAAEINDDLEEDQICTDPEPSEQQNGVGWAEPSESAAEIKIHRDYTRNTFWNKRGDLEKIPG